MIRELRNHWLSPLIFLGASFILNLFWENLQAPLYAGFTSFHEHFWICFKAAGGDLLFMLVIYAALAIIHRDPFWISNRQTYAHPATWIITPLIGALLAVAFELWAVYVAHRWQYAAMPLIPVVATGLLPVLQMIVIPPLALFFAHFTSKHR
ncbi:TPA: hypothetical protein DCL30_02100 [Candidatus Peribacteria bacterium]|nr:MAG: hypothetical protein A3J91_04170 [Candidatus Peribacteria bacterium RIFOXYC2_FULL_58_10]OGJ85235.1 MAG: hypothetical protein A2529_02115 [Candidatus Peribacteria bacterium RIFOXYD2_FULL_58_15]HAI98319.1 hypothetical protein [Candidatus Peribacteria bacterium]HAS33931.1 hypothetical protein [Candidatus Peribacteria bacterium]